ncbi:thiamine phosphate synthase [Idiomarina abyssalis]|uniref:thiamine phosphate synthase n=1 Tax=Idiomarina abyssalis TaxID=86102 RepID=UPI0006C85555|nr:thiamine phosphate synthase [Idiomarina abyssalis]KPD22785.1 thiamine monophosphate synthase [Idiomarina abyssalis]SFT47630.1 thiamine-phosphate diphosphorylase [Idiomarina abyssalis]
MSVAVVWTVAGSDSGGGAGIQADLNTFRSLNVHGCSVITTVTAQNSVETTGLFPLAADAIRQQLECLQQDMPPAAIKIGLLSNVQQLQCVADFLKQWPDTLPRPFVVWDPVVVSTQQDRLSELLPEHCTELLPLVDIMTPNLDELSWLSGVEVIDENSMCRAAEKLFHAGLTQILITGTELGHSDEISDYYLSADEHIQYIQQKLETKHSHGTGCTLSSAIAAALAHDYPLEDAITVANAYVHQGLIEAKGIGRGPGPVAHTHWPQKIKHFPRIKTPELPCVDLQFPRLDKEPGLYPVVDSYEWIEKLLKLGIKTLQLRIKDPDAPQLEAAIKKSIQLAEQYSAQLFINDHWQLAIKHSAYGVHLGQEDLTEANLHAIQQAGLRLGISTHSYTELLIAQAYTPSYIALGHIFPTQTKAMPSKPQGLERLRRYVALLAPTNIPAVAIGGISLDRVAAVKATGINGIAVVSAITAANDVEQAVHQLLTAMDAEAEIKEENEAAHAE